MEKQGYAFRFDKYATMILPGTGRTVRFKTLWEKHTPEAIQNRILYPKASLTGWNKHLLPAASFLLGEKSRPAEFPACGRSTIPISLYKMGALPKKSPGTQALLCGKISAKLDQRIEQAEFIFKNHIEDRGRLRAIRQKAEDEIAVLLKSARSSTVISQIPRRLASHRRNSKAAAYRQAVPEYRNPFH